MTNFEKQLKQSLTDYQPDVSGQGKSWSSIQKKLDSKKRVKYFAGVAAGIIVVASAFVLWPTPDTQNIIPTQPTTDTTVLPEKETTVQEQVEPQIVKSTEDKVPSEKPNNEISLPMVETEDMIDEDNSSITEPEVHKDIKSTIPKSDNATFYAEVSVDNAKVCFGEKLQFHLNTKEPVSVEWTFSNGSTSEEPNPSLSVEKSGKYAAYATLTSLITGNSKKVYLKDGFVVSPKENYTINVDEIYADNFERKYKLEVDGKNIVKVNWIGQKTHDRFLAVELNERGNYQYTAEIFDINGCKYVINKNFNVESDNNLLAPTAFTPNTLDGVNDYFLPEALNTLPAGKFLLRVINPSTGRILFETESPDKKWNGYNPETGKIMPAGTYVWTAIVYGKNASKTYTGKISIVN